MGLEIVFAVVFSLGFFAGYQAGPEKVSPEKTEVVWQAESTKEKRKTP